MKDTRVPSQMHCPVLTRWRRSASQVVPTLVLTLFAIACLIGGLPR